MASLRLRLSVLLLSCTALLLAAEGPPVAAQPLSPPLPAPLAPAALPPARGEQELRLDLGGGVVVEHARAVQRLSLDGTWRCSGLSTARRPFPDLMPAGHAFAAAGFDDSGWDAIAVPLDWYRAYPKARAAGGDPHVLGWYRRSVELPPEAAGRGLVLHFGVVGYQAELWVNGVAAGGHHGDFTPWEVDVSTLLRPGANTLALRVRSGFGERFGAAEANDHAYGSQWSIGNIKGGLWQSCHLRIAPRLRTSALLVDADPATRRVRLAWTISNPGSASETVALRALVNDARDGAAMPVVADLGRVVLAPGDNHGSAELVVPAARAWSPDAPHLYWLSLAALGGEGGQELAALRSERFGFRRFAIDGRRFTLNGAPLFLVGENLRAIDYGGHGRSPAEESARIVRDLAALRANGYTMVRNAHMPVAPEVLERADELGLLIYDEWAWCFTENLAPAFPTRNAAELAEWVRRDHNHPSVAMWSCGNEVHYERPAVREQLDRQVALVRSLDLQRRPVGSFSGCARGYGTAPLDTDFLDLHNYLGLSQGPWTTWPASLEHLGTYLAGVYGARAAALPLVVWECAGFSWGPRPAVAYRPGEVDAFLKLAELPTTWVRPEGIGFAGSLGAGVALDESKGLRHGRRLFGRRVGEMLRRSEAVVGFAPWFQDFTLDEARQWTQRVFPALAGANGLPLRHPIAGRRHQQRLLVVNQATGALAGARARLSLTGDGAGALALGEWPLPAVPAGGRVELPVAFDLPEAAGAGWWQLGVEVVADGVVRGVLGYDLFVCPAGTARQAVAQGRTLAVLAGGDAPAVQRWLGDLGLSAKVVADAAALEGSAVAILPPGLRCGGAEAERLRAWVRAGGVLVALEQDGGDLPALGRVAVPAANTFVELVVPAHPLFAGLSQECFDTSDLAQDGLWVRQGLAPLAEDVLMARGPFLGQQGVSGVVCEGRLGAGRILASQLAALGQWDRDSVATVYLRNLARYLADAAAAPAAGIRPWREDGGGMRVAAEACRSLDLRVAANRGFADEVAGDGRGGWTDQGFNDFRMMPLGHQLLAGVPFEILDPASNQERSCVVLGGGGRDDQVAALPRSVEGIPVGGAVSRLFMLHAGAWLGNARSEVYRLRVRFADGRVSEVPVESRVSIGDWWTPAELPGARLALSRSNDQLRDVGLYLMAWDNPHPEAAVASLDLVAPADGRAVALVVAITVEQGNSAPLRFLGGWKALVDRAGGDVRAEGVGLPQVAPADQPAPGGLAAVRLGFPSPLAEGTRWAVPAAKLALPPAEAARLGRGGYSALTFWVRSEDGGALDLVLPNRAWKEVLATRLRIEGGGVWRKMRLALDRDLGHGRGRCTWPLGDLAGELFLFNGRKLAAGAAAPAPVSLLIADVRLE